MRHVASAWILAAFAIGVASAADRPAIGPPAAWVLVPEQGDSAAVDSPDAALQILQSDQQIRITSELVESYVASRVRIQTPQGLGSMGTLRFTWKPDSDVLTVHQLSVTRAGQSRDLLGDGAGLTILRREDQLEQSVLTGALTAVLQPPGLQVGDIVDVRYTLSRHDPVVADTPDGAFLWPAVPVSKVRLRLLWPEKLPLRWRASSFMPAATPLHKDGWAELTYQASNLVPLLQPTGAPARFTALRMVEHTTFQDWQHLSRRLAPLYVKASKLAPKSPLHAEVARIRAENKSDAARAAAALRLVQDQIRYVLLAMNDGGLVPANADDTWQRRFGDCKAKTVLLLALLRELGIDGDPVAVSSNFGDGMDTRLPGIGLFDHVLVRSKIAGRTYWLDGTRLGDRKLDGIEPPPFLWALPLVAGGSELVAIAQEPLQTPRILRTLEIDATEGISIAAPFRAEMVMNGDLARATQRSWDNVPEANRDESLRAFWREQYNGLTIEKTQTRFDDERGQLTWNATGTVLMEWDPTYNTYDPPDMGLGFRADYTRPKGTSTEAPYSVGFPAYERNTETIRLPPEGGGFTVTGTDIATTVAGREFRRKATIENGVFVAETNYRSLASEFPANETANAQRILLEMSRNDLYLKKPASYLPTRRELQAQAGTTLDTTEAYILRANQMMARKLVDQALADLDRAVQLDPKQERAYITRAMVRTTLRQFDAARSDLRTAMGVNSGSLIAKRFLALLEMQTGQLDEAVILFGQAIDKEQSAGDFTARGTLYALLGKNDLSLQDTSSAISKDPKNFEGYFRKAEVLRRLHRSQEIHALAESMALGFDGTEDGIVSAVNLLANAGEKQQAVAMLDRSIQKKPGMKLYLLRANMRDDKQGVLADLQAAVKLQPDSNPVQQSVLRKLLQRGWYPEALVVLVPLEQRADMSAKLKNLRGVLMWHLGDRTAALQAFEQARAQAMTATVYNNLCWDKATLNAALEEALKDCDTALQKDPDCRACMDSRGFVLLRMGRFKDSIAAYDMSLLGNAWNAPSLYGRGIAQIRLGNRDAGEKDLSAARIMTSDIFRDFESYGLTP